MWQEISTSAQTENNFGAKISPRLNPYRVLGALELFGLSSTPSEISTLSPEVISRGMERIYNLMIPGYPEWVQAEAFRLRVPNLEIIAQGITSVLSKRRKSFLPRIQGIDLDSLLPRRTEEFLKNYPYRWANRTVDWFYLPCLPDSNGCLVPLKSTSPDSKSNGTFSFKLLFSTGGDLNNLRTDFALDQPDIKEIYQGKTLTSKAPVSGVITIPSLLSISGKAMRLNCNPGDIYSLSFDTSGCVFECRFLSSHPATSRRVIPKLRQHYYSLPKGEANTQIDPSIETLPFLIIDNKVKAFQTQNDKITEQLFLSSAIEFHEKLKELATLGRGLVISQISIVHNTQEPEKSSICGIEFDRNLLIQGRGIFKRGCIYIPPCTIQSWPPRNFWFIATRSRQPNLPENRENAVPYILFRHTKTSYRAVGKLVILSEGFERLRAFGTILLIPGRVRTLPHVSSGVLVATPERDPAGNLQVAEIYAYSSSSLKWAATITPKRENGEITSFQIDHADREKHVVDQRALRLNGEPVTYTGTHAPLDLIRTLDPSQEITLDRETSIMGSLHFSEPFQLPSEFSRRKTVLTLVPNEGRPITWITSIRVAALKVVYNQKTIEIFPEGIITPRFKDGLLDTLTIATQDVSRTRLCCFLGPNEDSAEKSFLTFQLALRYAQKINYTGVIHRIPPQASHSLSLSRGTKNKLPDILYERMSLILENGEPKTVKLFGEKGAQIYSSTVENLPWLENQPWERRQSIVSRSKALYLQRAVQFFKQTRGERFSGEILEELPEEVIDQLLPDGMVRTVVTSTQSYAPSIDNLSERHLHKNKGFVSPVGSEKPGTAQDKGSQDTLIQRIAELLLESQEDGEPLTVEEAINELEKEAHFDREALTEEVERIIGAIHKNL